MARTKEELCRYLSLFAVIDERAHAVLLFLPRDSIQLQHLLSWAPKIMNLPRWPEGKFSVEVVLCTGPRVVSLEVGLGHLNGGVQRARTRSSFFLRSFKFSA